MAAAFLIMGLSVAPLAASQYLGEVTWNGVDSDGHTITIKAGLSRVGGSYYEVQGQVPDAPGGRAIFSGGGVLVGSNLMLSVAMTQTQASGNQTMVMQINIDKSTFAGNFWFTPILYYIPKESLNSPTVTLPTGQYPAGMTINVHATSPLGSLPVTGTLTCSSPIALPATVAPQTSLLLE